MYFALRSFLHCAFVSFSPSLYFGMQNWSVLFFSMSQTVYHAWDLLFLFFHLSGSKTVFMGTALELKIQVFLRFLCVWNRFQGCPLSFYFLYSWWRKCLFLLFWLSVEWLLGRSFHFSLLWSSISYTKSLLTPCQNLLFLHQSVLYFMNYYPLGFHWLWTVFLSHYYRVCKVFWSQWCYIVFMEIITAASRSMAS